jgi:tetratricopeptide (TPR) repeat protein
LLASLAACPRAGEPPPDDARIEANAKRLDEERRAELPDADMPAPLDLARALTGSDALKADAAERAISSEAATLAVQLRKDGVAPHEAELKGFAALPRTNEHVRLAVAQLLVTAAKESLSRLDLTKAAQYAQLGRELDEAQSGAYQVLGELAFAKGDHEQALQLYDTGLLRDPLDAELKSLAAKRRAELPASELSRRASEHFSLVLEGGPDDGAASFALQCLEEAYRAVGALFDVFPDDKLSVVLYPNRPFDPQRRHPAWAAGSFDGRLRTGSGGALTQPALLRAALFHEYAHVLFHRATGGTHAPAWLNEGLAELASEMAGPQTAVTCATGHAFPLRALEGQKPTRPASLEARHAVERLAARGSMEKVRALLQAMKQRQDFDRAFEKTFGEPVTAFSAAFDAEATP